MSISSSITVDLKTFLQVIAYLPPYLGMIHRPDCVKATCECFHAAIADTKRKVRTHATSDTAEMFTDCSNGKEQVIKASCHYKNCSNVYWF